MSEQDEFIMVGNQHIRRTSQQPERSFLRNAQNILNNNFGVPNAQVDRQMNATTRSMQFSTPTPNTLQVPKTSLELPSVAQSNSTEDLYEKAVVKMRQSEFKAAESLLNQYISAASTGESRSKGRCALGQLQQMRKEDDLALENYNLCLIDDTKNEVAHVNFAGILLQKGINEQSALNHLQQCLKINPMSYEAHFNLAYLYYKMQQNIDKSLVHLEKCLSLQADEPRAHRLYASVYMEQRKTEKATMHLQKAINARPIESDYFNLASLYLDQNYLNEAEQFFNKCLTINPRHSGSLLNLGVVYLLKKQFANAEQSYKKALEVNPSSFEAIANLANIYFQNGKYAQAEDYYKKAQIIDPSEAHLQLNLGRSQFEQKQFDSALKNLSECVEKDDRLFYAHKLIGDIYYQQAKYIQAIQSFEKYIQDETNDSEAYLKLASSQYQTLLFSKASKNISLCLMIHPNYREALELQKSINEAMR